MTRIDLHPEDLLDRARNGLLTHDEHKRLRAHVQRCSACAMELAWLADGLHARSPSEDDAVRAQRNIQRAFGDQPDASLLLAPRRRWLATAITLGVLLTASAAAAAIGGVGVRWVLLQIAARPSATQPDRVAPPKPRLHLRKAEPRRPSSAAAARDAPAPGAATTPTHATELPAAPATGSSATQLSSPSPLYQPKAAARRPSAASPPAAAAADSALDLLSQAQTARAHAQFDRALAVYRTLAESYPGSRAERASRIARARLLLDAGDATQALQLFERYLASSPAGPLAEEAQLGRALSLERLGERDQAHQAWQELLSAHPASLHARLARERMVDWRP